VQKDIYQHELMIMNLLYALIVDEDAVREAALTRRKVTQLRAAAELSRASSLHQFTHSQLHSSSLSSSAIMLS
jgi:hypothetical protein